MTLAKLKSRTKSATVIALLKRAKGARLDEICKTTKWQPHSARAFLTGLRTKGFVLTREQSCGDGTAYRITQTPAQKAEPASS